MIGRLFFALVVVVVVVVIVAVVVVVQRLSIFCWFVSWSCQLILSLWRFEKLEKYILLKTVKTKLNMFFDVGRQIGIIFLVKNKS